MQEIKEFAPVIIPTLNRYEHLKRCLESLEQCTWADKTDVYVVLDYPPSERYVDGWKKNDEYLSVKEKNHGFKTLNIIRRKTNYFMQGRVYDGIIEKATMDRDCYITSEDDNEFSPCFLDFMNKAFEKFKDDEKVLSVSGYCHPDFVYNGDNPAFFSYEFTAWGLGLWTHKQRYLENFTTQYFEKFLLNKKKAIKVMRMCPALFNMLPGVMYKYKRCDVQRGIYNFIEGTTQLRPTRTLVKNWGYDGSGQNCGQSKNIAVEMQVLPIDTTFDFSSEIIAADSQICLRFYRRFNIPKDPYHKLKYYFAVIRNYINYIYKHA